MFKNKEVFLLIVAIVLVLILFIFVVFISFVPRPENPNNSSVPTPFPSGVSGGENLQPGTQAEQEIVRRSYTIGQLINLLPYNGSNFSLFYSFSTNVFTLYINPSKQTEGNTEFDAFLKKNGIDNRSWFDNLVVSSVKVTPAP